MTVHWWMHWFWITRALATSATPSKCNPAPAVVAALLLVPLAAALPPRSGAGQLPTPPPDPAGSWDSWPPPYEDEDDDEDGFLGPRALPLQAQPRPADDGASPSPELVSEGPEDMRVPEQQSPPGDQPATKLVAARDVQDVAVSSTAEPSSSSHLNTSVQTNSSFDNNATQTNATSGTRESKSFSPSAPASLTPPVKPLQADVDGKAGTAAVETAASAVPGDGATASDAAASASPEAEVSSGSPLGGASDVTPLADGSSQQPAEAYATASGEGDGAWTAYDASAGADDQEVGQPEDAEPAPGLRSRTAEREAADDEDVQDEPEVAPVSRGRVAPAGTDAAPMDAASITGIALGIVVFASLIGAVSFVMYRRRFLNKPQTLNDKCSNPDSSGYIDDSTLRENSEEMYSLDNDSFLNSLEAMTIQNYWTDNVKHTKL